MRKFLYTKILSQTDFLIKIIYIYINIIGIIYITLFTVIIIKSKPALDLFFLYYIALAV